MFHITKNDIVNNKVWYEDEFSNSLFVKRKDGGFVAKIRFHDKAVKCKPLDINIKELRENGGSYLNIEYPSGRSQYDDDIYAGIEGMTAVVQRWTEMLNDLDFMNNMPEFVAYAKEQFMKEDVTPEDLANYKYSIMKQYEELEEFVDSFVVEKS